MDNDRTYKSLVGAACFMMENEIDLITAKRIYEQFWLSPPPPNGCTADFAGEVLRQGGVASTSMTIDPGMVQRIVVDSLKGLRAVLLSFHHPHVNGETRWLCAYGVGPDGLSCMLSLDPAEPMLLRSELWPNVTGDVVVALNPSKKGVIVEIVGLSSILDEEEG